MEPTEPGPFVEKTPVGPPFGFHVYLLGGGRQVALFATSGVGTKGPSISQGSSTDLSSTQNLFPSAVLAGGFLPTWLNKYTLQQA